MHYVNTTKLMEAFVADKLPDVNKLLDEVDRETVIRVLKRSKAGVPKAIGITNEPVEEARFAKMAAKDKDRLNEIMQQIPQKPRKIIAELLSLLQRYPDVPVIHNYLAIAYHYNKQEDKYVEMLYETCRKFPEYLFGKLSLCEYCLNNDNHIEIPTILDRKMEIWMHYPNESVFHVSEVRTFYYVVGCYFAMENKLARALYHYFSLAAIGLDHPSVIGLGKNIIFKEIEKLRNPIPPKKKQVKSRHHSR